MPPDRSVSLLFDGCRGTYACVFRCLVASCIQSPEACNIALLPRFLLKGSRIQIPRVAQDRTRSTETAVILIPAPRCRASRVFYFLNMRSQCALTLQTLLSLRSHLLPRAHSFLPRPREANRQNVYARPSLIDWHVHLRACVA